MPAAEIVCWRMPRRALLASRLFVLCCGLISIGHGLSYTCFRRVHKGLLVLASQSALHYPWSSLSWQSALFSLIDHIRWLLDRLVCLMKYILGSTSKFAYRSIVVSAWEHFWSLWLPVSLYVGLDCLVWYTFVHGYGHVKSQPKVCWHIILAWCISRYGA